VLAVGSPLDVHILARSLAMNMSAPSLPPFVPPADEGDDLGWDSPNIPAAIVVSVGAGLATALGGALVFFPEFIKRVPQNTILGVSLAVSAGVMLYVSFIEIFAKALGAIEDSGEFSEGGSTALCTLMFFLGMLACVLLEMLVMKLTGGAHGHDGCPAHADPATWTATATSTTSQEADPSHVAVKVTAAGEMDEAEKARLSQMGLMTAVAIAIHNLPEGLATFLSTVSDVGSGASLGIAVAIHNVPEGLCVAMPIYYATGDKWKAFIWSLLSGVTEPIGGIAGYAVLQPVFTDVVYGCVFSMVGGMMVFIVCHELLPAAHRYMKDGNKTTAWLVVGMLVMAASLVIFAF